VEPGCENRVLRTSRLPKTGTYGVKSALQVHVPPGPAITAATTQRAWRALQVHHKGGPVRDASSKGGVEGAYLGPRLSAARAPAWCTSHHARQEAARSAPESPGAASA
jgi:hypothetical protein